MAQLMAVTNMVKFCIFSRPGRPVGRMRLTAFPASKYQPASACSVCTRVAQKRCTSLAFAKLGKVLGLNDLRAVLGEVSPQVLWYAKLCDLLRQLVSEM